MESVPKPVPGSLLGERFRVLSLLGEGGMGAVYEAENVLTHKRVAIKWLSYSADTPSDAAQRLLQEAQAAGRVRHPNVVDVYDVGRDGEVIFLVMELLEGESLRALLDRGGAQIHELIGLLMSAIRGVAAAHRVGVIHRDVKPENIFLARVGDANTVPKVLDFGISKLAAADKLTSTRTGTAIGTPMYMSYEQLTGQRDIDARVDVYAFGVILYEALTGRLPFTAETVMEWSIKLATTEPRPPSAHGLPIPPALDDLVLRAMARSREQRTPDLETLLRELEPFSSPQGFADLPAPVEPEVGALAMGATRRLPHVVAEPDGQPSAQAPTHAPASSSSVRRLFWLAGVGATFLVTGLVASQLSTLLSAPPPGGERAVPPLPAPASVPSGSSLSKALPNTQPALAALPVAAPADAGSPVGSAISDAGELGARDSAEDRHRAKRGRYRASKLQRDQF